MERAVRRIKQELVGFDELIKNCDDEKARLDLQMSFNQNAVKLKGQEAKLRDFCKKTGLDRDRYREQVFATKTEKGLRNFGKSTSAKAVYSAKKHYSDFVAVVGKENAPATLDKYYDLKYNNPEGFNKLKELYKGFSSGKLVRNANGQLIKIVGKTTLQAEPNSITQFVNSKGGIDRNYYDETGWQYKQITDNARNEKAAEGFGKHGEHRHEYIYDENHNLISRPRYELTNNERKENADIL